MNLWNTRKPSFEEERCLSGHGGRRKRNQHTWKSGQIKSWSRTCPRNWSEAQLCHQQGLFIVKWKCTWDPAWGRRSLASWEESEKENRMLSYILLSIVLPASVIFVFSTVNSIPLTAPLNPSYFLLPQIVLALFGRSLGVRRLYVRVLLGIFQVHIELGFLDNSIHLSYSTFMHTFVACPNYM